MAGAAGHAAGVGCVLCGDGVRVAVVAQRPAAEDEPLQGDEVEGEVRVEVPPAPPVLHRHGEQDAAHGGTQGLFTNATSSQVHSFMHAFIGCLVGSIGQSKQKETV